MPVPTAIAHPALTAYSEAKKRAEVGSGDNVDTPSFADLLTRSIDDAVDTGRTSETISLQAASGGGNLQDVVEAVNAAEISLQTVVSIRDRVISAYQEIMRMPI